MNDPVGGSLEGEFRRLGQLLEYRFNDLGLLEQALTHRSASAQNNERLEFLGDAVLSFVISAELYARFTQEDEGRLSRLRASLVKGETLAKVAKDLALGDYLRLGSGELKSGGHRRESILADAFEATLGAVYLDGGIDPVRRIILALFAERMANLTPETVLKDPKTRLQEYLQSRRLPLPEYAVLTISGEAHKQQFEVSCRVTGLAEPTFASGRSRRKAEQQAAADALARLTESSS